MVLGVLMGNWGVASAFSEPFQPPDPWAQRELRAEMSIVCALEQGKQVSLENGCSEAVSGLPLWLYTLSMYRQFIGYQLRFSVGFFALLCWFVMFSALHSCATLTSIWMKYFTLYVILSCLIPTPTCHCGFSLF